MKRKGIVTASDVGFAPTLSPVHEDPTIRFRHHNLLQDYRDLQKETDAMKRKLEILIERKLSLLAEVQFLRSRYRYFMDYQISKPPQLRRNMKQKNLGMKTKAVKRKGPVTKMKPLGMPVSGSNANKKQKASCTVKRNALPPVDSKSERRISYNNIVPCCSSMSFDSNQRDLSVDGMEFPMLNSQSTDELLQKQLHYQEVEATKGNPAPVFDLNQLSAEELHTSNNQPKIEAHKISSGGGIEDPSNEIHLAVCRNKTSVKGPNKSGKRRISWQDQVSVGVRVSHIRYIDKKV